MTLVDTVKIGRKGGKARAANMDAGERKASSLNAITARWAAYYKLNPDKWKARLAREKKKPAKAHAK